MVVEPSRLVTSDAAGLRLLYVTITRTTKSLVIVHSGSLPEGLAPERPTPDPRSAAPAHRCSPRVQRGRPSIRSPRMLRRIWVVPPMIV